MGSRIDLVNKIFNSWKVLKYSHSNSRGEPYWLCECICGKLKAIRSYSLRSGSSKSCGCSKRLKQGEAAFNRIYTIYNISANKRNLQFNLTKKQFKNIIIKNCYYCNSKPNNISNTKTSKFIYNGIDRVDNTFGYLINNVVPCCKTCNRAKDIQNKEEFLNWIKTVYKNNFVD